MTIEEACRRWVDRDFSLIPVPLIKKAYQYDPNELELLSNNYPELDWPACWGWLFSPTNSFDERWIRDNISEVEECGFLIYESDECGLLLALDGAGYCFFEHHWIPLYLKRGFTWHKTG